MTDRPVWDDGDWSPLPILDHDIVADTCVVGLGGSGLSAVRELRAMGQRVVGIDAARVGGGAAGRNGGFLLAGSADFYHDAVAAHGRESTRALYRRTLAEIDRIDRDTPSVVRRTGSLRIADSAEELADCALQFRAMQDDGFEVEHYHGREGEGLLFPRDAAFNPLLRCRLLARRAIAEGAQLFESTPAITIATGVVTTPEATIRCGQVIVAIDGKLEVVLPELIGRVRSARLQMIATAPAPPGLVPRPVYLRWGYEYWQQLPDGRIALGGFRDQGGDAEWSVSPTVSTPIQQRLETLLRARLGVEVPIVQRWAGVVGYSVTGLPVVEEVRPGVWAAGGYNGTGNLIGALAGRAVAQMAVQGHSPLIAELQGRVGLDPPRRSGDVTNTSEGAPE